jgi:hypothetical protein
MGSRVRAVLVAAFVFAALIALCAFIGSDKKLAHQAKLQNNVRLAKLARHEIDEAGNPTSARIELAEPVFEFGALAPFDDLAHTFVVRNAGQDPLRLKLTKIDSECISTEFEKTIIPPGASDRITLNLKVGAEENGPVEYGITFSTNDSQQPTASLSLRGAIRTEYWLDPPEILELTHVDPGVPITREFHVFVTSGELPELKNLRGDSPDLKLLAQPADPEIVRRAGAACGWTVLATWHNVTGSDARVPGKSIAASKKIRFDLQRNGEVVSKSLYYWVQQAGMIQLFHEQLNTQGKLELGNIAWGQGKDVSLLARARNGSKKSLQIDRVEVEPKFLQVELQPLPESETTGSYKLLVRIPPDAPEGSYAGDDAAIIKLHFSEPAQLERTIKAEFYVTKE